MACWPGRQEGATSRFTLQPRMGRAAGCIPIPQIAFMRTALPVPPVPGDSGPGGKHIVAIRRLRRAKGCSKRMHGRLLNPANAGDRTGPFKFPHVIDNNQFKACESAIPALSHVPIFDAHKNAITS